MATQQQATNPKGAHTASSATRAPHSTNSKSTLRTTQVKQATQPAQSVMPHYLKRRLSPNSEQAVALYGAGFASAILAVALAVFKLEPVDVKQGLLGVTILVVVVCIGLGVASNLLHRNNPYRYIGKNDMRMRLLWNEIHTRPLDQQETLKQALKLAYSDRAVTKSSATLAYVARIKSTLDLFFADAVDLMPSNPTNEQPFASIRQRAATTLNELLKLDDEHRASQQIARDTSAAYDNAADAYRKQIDCIGEDSKRRLANNITHRTAPQVRLSDDDESSLPAYTRNNLKQ